MMQRITILTTLLLVPVLGACSSEPTSSGNVPITMNPSGFQPQQPQVPQQPVAGGPPAVVNPQQPPGMQPVNNMNQPPGPMNPAMEPTMEPTTEPTTEPTMEPTTEPTMEPTTEPTMEPMTPTGPTPGMVTVSFTTVTYGGEYAPGNYGAVWFEDPSGTFIKTAKRWAGTRHASDLVTWTGASGGWGGGLFSPPANEADMVDAVSMATLRTHQAHMVTWNMMDADMALVPDGEYVAVIEVTEDRAARPGPVLKIPFTKGTEPQMVQPSDEASFTGITLQYTP